MQRVKGIKTSPLKRVSLITFITVTSYHTANKTEGWRFDGGGRMAHPARSLNLPLLLVLLLRCSNTHACNASVDGGAPSYLRAL